ncbi:hypothetical protein SALBM217S_10903 [Streptomyces griseoloalbus]
MSGGLPASTISLTLRSTSFHEYTLTSTSTSGWSASYRSTRSAQYFLLLSAAPLP